MARGQGQETVGVTSRLSRDTLLIALQDAERGTAGQARYLLKTIQRTTDRDHIAGICRHLEKRERALAELSEQFGSRSSTGDDMQNASDPRHELADAYEQLALYQQRHGQAEDGETYHEKALEAKAGLNEYDFVINDTKTLSTALAQNPRLRNEAFQAAVSAGVVGEPAFLVADELRRWWLDDKFADDEEVPAEYADWERVIIEQLPDLAA